MEQTQVILLVFGILILIFLIATFSVSIFKTKRSIVSVSVDQSGDGDSNTNTNPDGGNSNTTPPKEKWDGVKEAIETCYEGGGKFTVSFVPAGVRVDRCNVTYCNIGSCNVGSGNSYCSDNFQACEEDIDCGAGTCTAPNSSPNSNKTTQCSNCSDFIKTEKFGNTQGVKVCSDTIEKCDDNEDCSQYATCEASGSDLSKVWGNERGNKWSCNDNLSYRTPNCEDGVTFVTTNGGTQLAADTASNSCSTGMDQDQVWKSEIAKALKWWEDCFFAATGQVVAFEILNVIDNNGTPFYSDEIFVDNYLPTVNDSTTLTNADKLAHGIGDIRICAYDFYKDGNYANANGDTCSSLCSTLMYCFPHLPCGSITKDANGIANFYSGCDGISGPQEDLFNGYRGNICINKSYCWRKDDDVVVYDNGNNSSSNSIFPTYKQEINGQLCYHNHYSLCQVIAHELGHSIGLSHDCHPENSNDSNWDLKLRDMQDFPCIDPPDTCNCIDFFNNNYTSNCNLFNNDQVIDNCTCTFGRDVDGVTSSSTNGCSIMQPYANPYDSLETNFSFCSPWIQHYLKLFYCGSTAPGACSCDNNNNNNNLARFANKFNPETIMNKKLIKHQTVNLQRTKDVQIFAVQTDGKCKLFNVKYERSHRS